MESTSEIYLGVVGVCTGAYTCAVVSEINKCHSLGAIHLIFDTKSLTGPQGSPVRLGWLSTQPQGALRLCLSSTAYKHMLSYLAFYMCSGNQNESSCPRWQALTKGNLPQFLREVP